jgi:ABC-type antimicrobial peptide transport system permease subunit
MALGATPGEVLRLVMGQGFAIVGAGLVLGLALSWLAAKAIAAGLYGVGAADPAAWGGAVGVMLLSAGLANYLPARRAAHVDPSTALRTS